jgi:hypothetical protein
MILPMKQKRLSLEQIVAPLKQVEIGSRLRN